MGETVVKAVFIGEAGVGKTSIIERSIRDTFTHTNPTIGAQYVKIMRETNGCRYIIDVWDTAGQEKFHSLTPIYLRRANVVYIVCSFDNKKSLENVDYWLKETQMQDYDGALLPMIILLGNKSDLMDEGEFNEEDLQSKGHSIGADQTFVVSAMTGFNIDLLWSLVDDVYPTLTEDISHTAPENMEIKRTRTCC